MNSHDGKQYGPITRAELDEWVADGLISPNCHLLRAGESHWRPAAAFFPHLATQTATAGEASSVGEETPYTPTLHATGKKKTTANSVTSTELKQMSGATLISSDVYDVGERRSLMERLKASVMIGPIQEHESHVDSLQLFWFRDSLGEFATIVPYDNGMIGPIEYVARLPGRLSHSVVLLKQSGGKVGMEVGAMLGANPLGALLRNLGTKVESVWAGTDGSVPPVAAALNQSAGLSQGIRWEGTVGGGPMTMSYRLSWGVQALPLDDASFLLVAQGVPEQKMFGLRFGTPWFHAYRREFGQFIHSRADALGEFQIYDPGTWLDCAIEVLRWVDA